MDIQTYQDRRSKRTGSTGSRVDSQRNLQTYKMLSGDMTAKHKRTTAAPRAETDCGQDDEEESDEHDDEVICLNCVSESLAPS